MSDPRQTQDTPFARWRERRQAKRQLRLERVFDARQRSGSDRVGSYHSSSPHAHNGPAWFWAGGGGDGGGGGGDGGGGGC